MPSSESLDVSSEWVAKPADPRAVRSLTAHLGCPLAIAQVLVSRGIDTPAAAEAFLSPTLDKLLDEAANDPTQLLGMDAAIERILSAIRAAEPILIYGDYDVDGTTATVLLKTTIERIALAIDPQSPAQVTYHVPHRIREGYGMQNAILAEAAAAGIRLVISVDTGIRAVAEAAEARVLGLDLIVTDHHLPDLTGPDASALPDCLAVINPVQPGCPYPNKHLCGAAVAYKLAQALLDTRLTPRLLQSFLKVVAIGTIADVVPLLGENRVIARFGLEALRQPAQSGLATLIELSGLAGKAISAADVGFRLAPRINAALEAILNLLKPILHQGWLEKTDQLRWT